MSDPRTKLVGAGYDAMIDTWETWSTQINGDPRAAWLDKLTAPLPADGSVLELGCGGGTAESRELAARFRLTGVDISTEQLLRAQMRIPSAEFLHGDLATVEFGDASFDAVCAFYSLNHLPREFLGGLFTRAQSWLRPGGVMLASLGVGDEADWDGEWLGVPMYFSSYPAETNTRLVRDAGFEVLEDEVVGIDEPEGRVEFQWILARR